ncbi:MAG: universal stress protein [Burkholderiaceae bacterium]|jgi:nucleotide-binding universal stress UspA family protein
MYKHFLIPTDGSEPSEAAVDAALKLAAETGAKVLALNIQMPFVPPAFAEMPIAAPFTDAEYEKAVMQASERVLASVKARADALQVSCKTLTKLDTSVWETIIDVADDEACDLIFMASHGRKGLAALILGSETQKVLTHSGVPVLVHRRPQDAD